MRRDPLRFLTTAANQYGDVVRLHVNELFTRGRRIYLVRHPEAVRHVLQAHGDNFSRRTRVSDKMRQLLGEGLITSEGEPWLRRRRTLQPLFRRERLALIATIVTEKTEAMLARWRFTAAPGQPIEVEEEMKRLISQIIGEALFSGDVHLEGFGTQLMDEQAYILRNAIGIFRLPAWLPTAANRSHRSRLQAIDRVVLDTLKRRLAERSERDDLLAALMDARDGDGTPMVDREIRDESVTMFAAAVETTALALGWTWFLLSKHPFAAQRLHAELQTVLAGRLPTFADLPKLEYTTMVLNEALRLYPPTWMWVRTVKERDVIGGYAVPAGSMLMLSPYVTHRHPDFWENPEGFDPERFLRDRFAGLPRFAFFPFGGGPHQCIGNSLAMMEATLILATVAQRCRLSLVPGHPVEPLPLISLQFRHGLKMTVEMRKESTGPSREASPPSVPPPA